jgi:hypothetical protein
MKFILEYSDEQWGEHLLWHEKEFTTLDELKQEAVTHLLGGFAVRMYTKEK